ncbi:MAG: hypothetical protein E6235_10070 [Anaerococcus vaginalis]|uniref:hypothetical protein n=1 Tax=Anaerococcus vaginalis TaxID=33037 RepID=UPI002912B3D4|nr:hypothetical protein [Anaerococcus vaginalis]MDU5087340.1 hypothetical protein [Anaerococcus vaginalis]
MKKIDEKLAAEISLKKPAVSNSRLGVHSNSRLGVHSNSRLGVHSVHPQNPKLSFDGSVAKF